MATQPSPTQARSRFSSPLSLALINQLGYPGLGTIMAGQKVGWFQAGLMTLGLVAYFAYFYLFFQDVMPYLADVLSSGQSWNYHTFDAFTRPYRWLRLSGFSTSIAAWIWSLISTIKILKDS